MQASARIEPPAEDFLRGRPMTLPHRHKENAMRFNKASSKILLLVGLCTAMFGAGIGTSVAQPTFSPSSCAWCGTYFRMCIARCYSEECENRCIESYLICRQANGCS
jgi:hypothetical protein